MNTIARIASVAQHYGNPLHVYCRLIDVGFARRTARAIAEWYGRNIYPTAWAGA